MKVKILQEAGDARPGESEMPEAVGAEIAEYERWCRERKNLSLISVERGALAGYISYLVRERSAD